MNTTTSRLALAVLAIALLTIMSRVGAAGEDTKGVSIESSDGATLIRGEDIVRYDWETHTITLQPGLRTQLLESLRGKLVTGLRFQLVVSGEAIYTGTLTTSFSSASFSTPVIVLDGRLLDKKLDENQVCIDIGYPTEKFFNGKDPRGDNRIKKALKELGKLLEHSTELPKTNSPVDKLLLKRHIAIAQATMMALQNALENYRLDMRDYPTEKEGLGSLVKAPEKNANHWRGPYFEPPIPKDPWGNPYSYREDPERGVLLSSSGPDGKAGTDDDVVFIRR